MGAYQTEKNDLQAGIKRTSMNGRKKSIQQHWRKLLL